MIVRARKPAWTPAALALALVCLAGGALAAPVSISAQAQANLGLKIVAAQSSRRSAQVDAFAKVLDPGPLAQLESDYASAQSDAEASKAQAARARALNAAGGSVASKDVEAAEAQARDDAAKVALLRRRFGLEWGPGVAGMSPARRKALIEALSAGKAALVHVDTPSNDGQAGARTVDIDVGSDSVHGVVLGAARQAEPRLQSSGLIVEVTGPDAILLSIGLTQSAHINQSSAVSGVIIPRSAVIRFEGSDWAFVRTGPAAFERRLLADPVAEDQGLFVASGFAAGDQLVAQGAAELFAVEQAQRTQAR